MKRFLLIVAATLTLAAFSVQAYASTRQGSAGITFEPPPRHTFTPGGTNVQDKDRVDRSPQPEKEVLRPPTKEEIAYIQVPDKSAILKLPATGSNRLAWQLLLGGTLLVGLGFRKDLSAAIAAEGNKA